MPTLEIHKAGRSRPRTVRLGDGSHRVGRSSDCEVTLHDHRVSREHCVIEVDGAYAAVRDAGSRHGIKVNHQKTPQAPLADGDVVRVGPYQIVFFTGAPHPTTNLTPPRTADESAASASMDGLSLDEARDADASDDVSLEDADSAADAADARRALAALEVEASRLRNALADARRFAERLESDQATRRAEQDRTVALLTEENRRMRADLESVRTQSAAMVQELARSKAALAALESAAAAEQKRAGALSEDAARQSARVTALTAALDELTRHRDAAATESADLRARCTAVEIDAKQAASERDRALDELRKSTEAYRVERDAMTGQIAEAETRLREATAAAEDLRARLADVDRDRRDSADLLVRAETERERLAWELDEQQRIRETELERRTLAEAEVVRLTEALASAGATRMSLESALAERTAEIEQVRRGQSEMESRVAALRSELDAAAAPGADAAALLRAEQARAAAESNAASLAAELSAARAAHATIERELLDAQAKTDAPGRADAEVVPRLEADLSAAQATAESFKQRAMEAERAQADAERRLLIAHANTEDFKRRLKELSQVRAAFMERLRSAESQIAAARKETAAQRSRAARTEAMLREYLARGEQAGDLETTIVEMTDEEIAAATARGAAIVEIDLSSR
jgi:chromosome segregation ATPase